MLSAANREIRTEERNAAERRERLTVREILRWMDRLVAQLEENNLAGESRVQDCFSWNSMTSLAPCLPEFQ